MRLRPPRHAGQVSGMRDRSFRHFTGMKRRLLNLIALLWLVLCAGAAAVWVRSYWTSQFVCRYGADDRDLQLIISTGRVNLEWSTPAAESLISHGVAGLRTHSGPAFDY